jgi:hypothetical protein
MGEFGRLPSLRRAAQDALRTTSEERGSVDVHFSFNIDIRLRGKLAQRRVDIGALVRNNSENLSGASYSVLIGKGIEPSRSAVLRKFHFDYEPISQRDAREPKPSIHLQMCGELNPKHLEAGYNQVKINALYPHFEKPRIPCQPTSIALLLNWLLLEFQAGSVSQAVLRAPRWRKLVAEAERIVLTPYFKGAAAFLSGARYDGQPFLQHYLYEITL